ncbi:hypothetical protein, partial [Saccharopolyspora spinosa]|uniref:hypothetical protein n=1 Tax=Saccharopolyspora spinosa TaxID=60894 RepID=UPI0013050CBB
MPSGEGSRAPSVDRDPVAVLPVGLPADTVRVPVPAEVVAGGGLAEFVRGGVADSTGPVLLVSPGDPGVGVVVTPGQGSALAQGMGRDVVAMTQRQGGRGQQFAVFAADGSRPRPLAGPGAVVPAGGSGGVAGLAETSAPVPVASGGMTVARDEAPAARTVSAQESSVAAEGQPAGVAPDAGAGTVRDTGGIPVGRWSRSDLDREIARAKRLDLSSGEREAAGLVVRRAHDVGGLARADAVVSLEDVVALVAAKRRELGDDRQDLVVFSRALADRLGTQGSGLRIQAGAGPAQRSDVESAPVPFGELRPPVDECLQEWWAWTLGDVVDYVAGKAVPAEVPDEEVVRYLGPARAAELTSVSESTAQVWLDGRGQPSAAHLRLMREAARLPRSEELVRYLGPGRALEVTDSVYFLQDESAVWAWLGGLSAPYAGDVARLCRAVLGAIAEGLLRWPQPLRRVVWSENGIREAERRLAWADATKGGEFPSGALSQWKKVNNPDPPLRPEAREVI